MSFVVFGVQNKVRYVEIQNTFQWLKPDRVGTIPFHIVLKDDAIKLHLNSHGALARG